MTAVAGIEVRPAREQDAPALYAAWLAVRRHYSLIDDRIIPAPVSAEQFSVSLADRIEQPMSATFVAIGNGEVVGFITGGLEPGQPDRLPELHGYVGHLFVDPSRRREGIGRRLFEALADWARNAGPINHFEMTVLDADEAAREFWAAIGFRPFIQRLWAPAEDLGA